mmetsp:Transcript_28422/g.84153  ORF Transcript_28422/g.84153 Transcript_28422/m.84153 type:complete len:81 (-) Transcript_28422:4023-4265(-)
MKSVSTQTAVVAGTTLAAVGAVSAYFYNSPAARKSVASSFASAHAAVASAGSCTAQYARQRWTDCASLCGAAFAKKGAAA